MWITRRDDADGDPVASLWFARPGEARRLLDRSGGVMEGGSAPVSPIWVGATVVWAVALDHDGTDYDSWIVRLDVRTGRRVRVAIPNAYVESIARAGRRLAVRYVPTDETGQAVGPNGPVRTGVFALSRLDA